MVNITVASTKFETLRVFKVIDAPWFKIIDAECFAVSGASRCQTWGFAVSDFWCFDPKIIGGSYAMIGRAPPGCAPRPS